MIDVVVAVFVATVIVFFSVFTRWAWRQHDRRQP